MFYFYFVDENYKIFNLIESDDFVKSRLFFEKFNIIKYF